MRRTLLALALLFPWSLFVYAVTKFILRVTAKPAFAPVPVVVRAMKQTYGPSGNARDRRRSRRARQARKVTA